MPKDITRLAAPKAMQSARRATILAVLFSTVAPWAVSQTVTPSLPAGYTPSWVATPATPARVLRPQVAQQDVTAQTITYADTSLTSCPDGQDLLYFYYYQDIPEERGSSWCGAAAADIAYANVVDPNTWRRPYLLESCTAGVNWYYSHQFQDGSRYYSPAYRGINMVCTVQPQPPMPPLGCAAGDGGFASCPPDSNSPLPNGPVPLPVPPGTPPTGGPNPIGDPNSPSSNDPTAPPVDPSSSSCKAAGSAGDPIFAGTGSTFQEEVDYSGPYGLNFVRRYNSALPGWVHNFSVRVLANATTAMVVRPDGRAHMFSGSGPGVWTPEIGAQEYLLRLNPSSASEPSWEYITAHDGTEWYDAQGRLMSITQRGGLSYTAQQSGGLLRGIVDPFGHGLQFAYDAQNRLSQVTTPEGTFITYAYDAQGRLAQVTYPDGSTRKYLYENSTYPLALTGLVDERGIRFASWTYDAQGRAATSEHAGVARYQLLYGAGTTQITDPLGTSRTQVYATAGPRQVFAGQSQPCADCFGDAATNVVDPSTGLLTQSTDYLGVATLFTNDNARKLPLTITRAYGRAEQQQQTIQWHPNLRVPALITEAGRTTAFTYDGMGNMLSQTVADTSTNQARTWQWTYNNQNLVDSMTEPTGAVWHYGYDGAGNRTSVKNPLGQQTSYAYDAGGRVTSQTAPNGLVTAYAYDLRGRLTSQNRSGEISTFTYTPVGQVSGATLPDGYQLTYSYDNAQRLIAAADNRGATIQYTLDAMGNRVGEQVKDASGNIALATGRVINSLNRVAAIQGAQGQTTSLSYDANGEPVSSTDPLNQTTRQTLDGLGRATATTFADNTSAGQAWNLLDQLAQVTDPKGVATRYQRNAFGEVVSETSSDIGSATYQRDANGNVIATTDAKGNTANITRDALGRPTQIAYADQTQSFSYDNVGNIVRIDDASGSTIYTRDLHGRVLSKTQVVNDNSGSPSQYPLQYTYSGGDLASIGYPSGLQVFLRRSAGRITGIDVQPPNSSGKVQPVTPFVTGLVYTALGTPKSWSWSTGDTASRSFDADGRMTQSEIASYTYDAASRISGITQNLWVQGAKVQGNAPLYQTNVTWTADYDRRNRLTSFARSGASSTYQYDANSNRLTGVETTTSSLDLEAQFDADNATQSASQVQSVEAASNKLLGFTQTTTTTSGTTTSSVTTPVTYALDANGAMTSDGARTFVYDASGRLAKTEIFSNGEGADVAYWHNGLGQRVFKSQPQTAQLPAKQQNLDQSFLKWLQSMFGWVFPNGNAGKSTLGMAYVYDEQGNLLGEYDNGSSQGNGRTEYIWLPTESGQAMLVGMYKNGAFYAVHADHLGTPRLVTDSTKAPVWQWPYSAFGNNKPTGPLSAIASGTTTRLKATAPVVEVNLRFPGQYFDSESNLSYNYFRSYNGAQGRYAQPDPVGLQGGLSRFNYANVNAVNYIDPRGLLFEATLGGLQRNTTLDQAATYGGPGNAALATGAVGATVATGAAFGGAAAWGASVDAYGVMQTWAGIFSIVRAINKFFGPEIEEALPPTPQTMSQSGLKELLRSGQKLRDANKKMSCKPSDLP
jgi:RHS repeat-associated protein